MSTNPTGNAKTFRDGIMNLNINQFGRVGEVVVEILMNYKRSEDFRYDSIDEDGRRVEVKSTKVQTGGKRGKVEIVADNFYDMAMNFGRRGRLINQQTAMGGNVAFSCTIQQVKPDLFDWLFYLLFFKDIIEIFTIDKDSLISGDPNLGYSKGKLRINEERYQYHKSNRFFQSISYSDLMEIVKAEKSTG